MSNFIIVILQYTLYCLSFRATVVVLCCVMLSSHTVQGSTHTASKQTCVTCILIFYSATIMSDNGVNFDIHNKNVIIHNNYLRQGKTSLHYKYYSDVLCWLTELTVDDALSSAWPSLLTVRKGPAPSDDFSAWRQKTNKHAYLKQQQSFLHGSIKLTVLWSELYCH